jgi:hypothetical protein
MEPIEAGTRAKCPHCGIVVQFQPLRIQVNRGGVLGNYSLDSLYLDPGCNEMIGFFAAECPNCNRVILTLKVTTGEVDPTTVHHMVWPFLASRIVPQEVPEHIGSDYREASVTLNLSPKASAALSRRCLQCLLDDKGTKGRDLNAQIDQVLPTLPSYIAENVDSIRMVGNYAAHPTKSSSTDQIVEVEPGEAEWNLDVLDQLFDFFYVKPAEAARKRDALNAKLQDAKKPPLKTPPAI